MLKCFPIKKRYTNEENPFMSKSRIKNKELYTAGGITLVTSRKKEKDGLRWKISPKLFAKYGPRGQIWYAYRPEQEEKKTILLTCHTPTPITSSEEEETSEKETSKKETLLKESYITFIDELYVEGFEITYINHQNEIVTLKKEVWDQKKSLETFKEREVLSHEIALEKLIDHGKNSDLFYILDDYAMHEILQLPFSIAIKEKSLVKAKEKLHAHYRTQKLKDFSYTAETEKEEEEIDLTTAKLPGLEKLTLHKVNTPSLKLPKTLKMVRLDKCYDLGALDFNSLTELETLEINHCYSAKLITPLPKKLKKLTLDMHKNDLKMIPDDNIEIMNLLFNDESIEELDFSRFAKLKELNIYYFKKLKRIRAFPPNIKKISFNICPQLNELPELSDYKDLLEVILNHCPYFRESDPPDFPQSKIDESRTLKIVSEPIKSLTWQNKTITVNSLQEEAALSNSTYTDPNKIDEPKIAIYKGAKQTLIDPSLYRRNVYSHISDENGKIHIKASDSKSEEVRSVTFKEGYTENELKEFSEEDFLIEIPAGHGNRLLALPVLSRHDTITVIPPGAKLFKNPGTCQYTIELPASDHPFHIRGVSKKGLEIKPQKPVLTDSIKAAILKIIANTEWEKKLSDIDKKSDEEKLKLCKELEKYCAGFANTKEELKDETIDIILRAFKKKSGSCDLRSAAFVLFCQYLGIPANLIDNEIHAYVEIFVNNEWKVINLDGHQTNVKKLPAKPTFKIIKKQQDETKETYDAKKEYKIKDKYAIDYKTEILPPRFETLSPIFYPKLRVPNSAATTRDVVSWLSKQSPVLLKLKDLPEARNLAAALIKEAKTQKNPPKIFYLESQKDIDDYLILKSLQKNGKFKESKEEGSLAHFLLSEKGILIFNWARFTPTQIAAYKSIMDEVPTFEHEKVSKNIQIINITIENNPGCGALTSRATEIDWPSYIPKPQPIIDFQQSHLQEIAPDKKENGIICLTGEPDWESVLVGKSVRK